MADRPAGGSRRPEACHGKARCRIDWRAGFAATAESLGEAFLKPYVVPFEVSSVLLMVAMIGAIILTREEDEE